MTELAQQGTDSKFRDLKALEDYQKKVQNNWITDHGTITRVKRYFKSETKSDKK